jgi:hypothetical protein
MRRKNGTKRWDASLRMLWTLLVAASCVSGAMGCSGVGSSLADGPPRDTRSLEGKGDAGPVDGGADAANDATSGDTATGDAATADAMPDDTAVNDTLMVVDGSACRKIAVSAYGKDTQAIKLALAAAGPCDALYFAPGVYTVDATLQLKSGVSLLGDATNPPTWRSSSAQTAAILHDTKSPLRDVAIVNLRFDNVTFRFIGNSSYTVMSNITFRDCVFSGAQATTDWEGHYLSFPHTSDVTVDRCTFLRSSVAHGGRGINLWRSHNSVITRCFFGTTRDLEEGVPNGYFRTAINVNGYQNGSVRPREIRLHHNVARRITPAPACPSGGTGPCQDHGFYIAFFDRLAAVGNIVDGWDQSAAGGAYKIRNCEAGFIARNRARDSGFLLYTYQSATNPQIFHRMVLRDNQIDMGLTSSCTSSYCGILYWRNFGTAADLGYEEQVFVGANRFLSGGTIRLNKANLNEVCVEGGGGEWTVDTTGSAGTPQTSACTPSAAWSQTPTGLYWGDFDGDGSEDYAYYAVHHPSGPHWRVHRRQGHGYALEDFGSDASFSAETNRYPATSGDFNGDGRTDIVYRGRCGSDQHACWRVLQSTGNKLVAKDFGNGAYVSAETSAYGIWVGDFDGDGRDDLAYYGRCGSPGTPCLRVQRSTGASFKAAGWGDARFGPDTLAFGVQVGDFNGDGKDDLLYRGLCGANDHACWRVHLSTGSSFTAADWGDGLYAAPETRHFGLYSGDINGDGKDDIFYRGRCGSALPRWRAHVSTGAGFAVQCSSQRPTPH